MLAIVELLSGIRSGEDEFLRRRSAMRNMSEAHVSIDWRPPEFLMVGAFERTRSVVDNARRIDDMPKKLLAMSKRAVDSNSLKDFKSRLNLANAESVLEEIGAYDERVSKTFVTNTVKGDAYTKKVAEEIRSGVRPAPPLGKTWSLKKFSEHLARDTGLNRSITVYAVASQVSRLLGGVVDPGEIHDTYNSTIDAFIDAFSIASIKATGNMNAPGRNDGMDFMHFFYMNPSTVLLSDDVKQRSYAQGAGQSTVSFEEYRRLTLR